MRVLRFQIMAGNSTCYEHQLCYTRKVARSIKNVKARVMVFARRRQASVEHARAR